MKIVFWAPVHGQTRQSSNMLAIALNMVHLQQGRVLLTQTQFRMNDLEDAIVGRAGVNEIRERFYQDMGIDSLIRCIKRKRPEKPDVENCCVQLLKDTELVLLPGSGVKNYEVYYETFHELIVTVLEEAEKYFDVIMVDANPGMDPINRELFAVADIVVVNLSQNIGVVDSFFRSIPKELAGKNMFFLFGSYLEDSSYNLKNLCLRHKMLNRKNSGVVPVNVGFMDAISAGRIQDFFEANHECEQGDVNYMFIREVRQATERLCRWLGEVQCVNAGKENPGGR